MELRRVISAWDTFESYHSQMTFEAVWIDMINQGEKESNQGQRVPRTKPWAILTFRGRVENSRLEKWGRAWGERAKGVMFQERGNSQLCEMLPRNQGKWGRKMNIGFGTWPTTLSSDGWLIPRRVVDFLGIAFHNWMYMGACLFICLFVLKEEKGKKLVCGHLRMRKEKRDRERRDRMSCVPQPGLSYGVRRIGSILHKNGLFWRFRDPRFWAGRPILSLNIVFFSFITFSTFNYICIWCNHLFNI